MFSIHTDTFAGYTRYLLKNEQTNETIAVLPDYGGIIQELVLSLNDHVYSIIDGVTEEDLPGNMWYKSSLLFPFPGRIKDGTYTFEGKDYQLPINELMRQSALHGMVADKSFQIIRTDIKNDRIILELAYTYTGQLTGYPFPYTLTIKYTLLSNHVFRMDIRVQNTGTTNMPMGFGWHPYFKTGSRVDQLRIILPSKKYYELDAFVVPTGKIKQMEGFTATAFQKGENQIAGRQFDHGFTGGQYKGSAKTLLHDESQNLTICLTQSRHHGFNYTQVFTPSHRNSIAIEPQTCMANVFNNNIGLLILEPGKEWVGDIAVHLQ